jgi:aryl-alcohol dehydrogenase-like predicted oxidoreductase
MTVGRRVLGRSGIEVSSIGLGCWAIGGPLWAQAGPTRTPMGWGTVDDRESIRAIHRALELGINFFDTANNYGAGHSERILGRAVERRREDVVIATKFGSVFDEPTRTFYRDRTMEMSLQNVRATCTGSLLRLGTDYIDLYLLHVSAYDLDGAHELIPVLEQLVSEGKIRWYGWSTDDPRRASIFADGQYCTAVEYRLNVLHDAPEMIALAEQRGLASIIKSPLASGLLTGKFRRETTFPADDGRHGTNFAEGAAADRLDAARRLRPILARGGRSMTQGALEWILARSHSTVPIPGFKTVEQVTENARAARTPSFTAKDREEIERIAGRET